MVPSEFDGVDPEVARDLERFEARVWADAVAAAPPEVAEELGLSATTVAGGIALVASRFPSILYNRTFGFGLDAPFEESDLERALALYSSRGPFSIQPSPLARPTGIPDRLRARGLESWFDWVIWARDARAPLAAPEATIERIGAASAERWARLATEIFRDEAPIEPWLVSMVGRSGWSHYWSLIDDRPIAVGASFVAGELAWIGWGGTLPEHRRRGLQAAMIARRVHDAAASGAHWVRSETADDLPDKPNSSFRNMARSGFRLVYRRPSHVVMPGE